MVTLMEICAYILDTKKIKYKQESSYYPLHNRLVPLIVETFMSHIILCGILSSSVSCISKIESPS